MTPLHFPIAQWLVGPLSHHHLFLMMTQKSTRGEDEARFGMAGTTSYWISDYCFVFLAECTFDVASDTVTLPSLPAVSALFAEFVGNTSTNVAVTAGPGGARLALPQVGAAASLPEGALPRGRKETLYLSLVREDRCRPCFPEGKMRFLILKN